MENTTINIKTPITICFELYLINLSIMYYRRDTISLP